MPMLSVGARSRGSYSPLKAPGRVVSSPSVESIEGSRLPPSTESSTECVVFRLTRRPPRLLEPITHSRPVALQRLQGVVTTPSTTGLQHGQPNLKPGKDRPEVSKRAGIFSGLYRTLFDRRPRGILYVGLLLRSKGRKDSQIAGALPFAAR